jgi:hypothetical protein
MTSAEETRFTAIHSKAVALQTVMAILPSTALSDTLSWFEYLIGVKKVVGNHHNDLSFLAKLITKEYLVHRFDLAPFDAAEKPEGANGLDLDLRTRDGKRIICEIKTTQPCQPGFGANQHNEIKSNLQRLSATNAAFKLMLVSDAGTFEYPQRPRYSGFSGVEVVNLLTRQRFLLGASA